MTELCESTNAGGRVATYRDVPVDWTPAVSVLMPVRNGGSFFEDAVNSILSQSLSDLELIVVDDGSADETLSHATHFAAADHRVRVFSNRSTGLVCALNFGASMCRAPLIARMDADDISHEQRLAIQLSEFQRRPKLVLLGSQIVRINARGEWLKSGTYPTGPKKCAEHLTISSPFCHPAIMMRAEAFRAAGCYREIYRRAEDYDLWLRLAELGEIDNLATAAFSYRVHANSTTARHTREQAAHSAFAVNAARARHAGRRETAPPFHSADLSDILVAFKTEPEEQERAVLVFWRVLVLNGGLRDDRTLGEFTRTVPELSRLSQRFRETRAFTFMMLRASALAARRGRVKLLLLCLFHSLTLAPLHSLSMAVLIGLRLSRDLVRRGL